MFVRFLIISALFSFSLNTCAQQVGLAENKEHLAKMIRTPGVFESTVDSYGVKGSARQVMIDYFHEIYATDELLDYVLKQLQQKKFLKGQIVFNTVNDQV
jgi:hypothetical protein